MFDVLAFVFKASFLDAKLISSVVVVISSGTEDSSVVYLRWKTSFVVILNFLQQSLLSKDEVFLL